MTSTVLLDIVFNLSLYLFAFNCRFLVFLCDVVRPVPLASLLRVHCVGAPSKRDGTRVSGKQFLIAKISNAAKEKKQHWYIFGNKTIDSIPFPISINVPMWNYQHAWTQCAIDVLSHQLVGEEKETVSPFLASTLGA